MNRKFYKSLTVKIPKKEIGLANRDPGTNITYRNYITYSPVNLNVDYCAAWTCIV